MTLESVPIARYLYKYRITAMFMTEESESKNYQEQLAICGANGLDFLP